MVYLIGTYVWCGTYAHKFSSKFLILFGCILNIVASNNLIKHVASKIENPIKYSSIPESAQINESQFPIMSPYNLYKQKVLSPEVFEPSSPQKDHCQKSISSLLD